LGPTAGERKDGLPRRIAFHIQNPNNLKVFAPVIDHLLGLPEGGWEPMIITLGRGLSQAEPGVAGHVRRIWGEKVEVLTVPEGSTFLELVKSSALEVIVNTTTRFPGLDQERFQDLVAQCRRQGTKLVAMPHLYDIERDLVADPRSAADHWDLLCLVCHHSLDYLESALGGTEDRLVKGLLDRCAVTGYPELDGLKSLKREEVLDKYGLPGDRPIIVFSTAFDYATSPLVRSLLSRFKGDSVLGPGRLLRRAKTYLHYPHLIPYRRYLESLSAFAAANGAYLVGKTRTKHKDPDYVIRYADRLIDDVSFYPFTTLELLKVAHSYFGFFSFAALEAVVCGCFATTFIPLPWEYYIDPRYAGWLEFFALRPGGVWNWPGASRVIEGHRRSSVAVLAELSSSGLEAYRLDKAVRQAFQEKYLAYPGSSSERFMAAVSSLF